MNLTSTITKNFLKRKIATVVLVSASVVSFATLGDDSGKKSKKDNSLVVLYSAKNFSLRSNYNYKNNNLFTQPERKNFITLNSVATYQKGNSTYVLPLKKMPLSGKIKFTSSPDQRF